MATTIEGTTASEAEVVEAILVGILGFKDGRGLILHAVPQVIIQRESFVTDAVAKATWLETVGLLLSTPNLNPLTISRLNVLETANPAHISLITESNQSSCVTFVANPGTTPRVAPKQKRTKTPNPFSQTL